MARRPDDTRGSLVFQEGKRIEGDFYIIAVYDDPASATVSFSAYELENDSTYTYPLTYSEFDTLFKFDSELMNPSNQDARFHWVIERLDFVQDNKGQKVLCLAQEPTPENEEDDELVEDKPKKQTVQPAIHGRIDAATRAKLLKELDTQDEDREQIKLVKSEMARKRFLADLHAKRQLEQLKAAQRLLKADEEREARWKKLEVMKQQQKFKAEQHRANREAKRSTMAQLEVLMKQKEAQAIRRLIQEKDELDRGMGREKDAARQRRKMQERSQQEIALIEAEKAKQLDNKREENVKRQEQKILRRNRQIYDEVREYQEKQRAKEMELRERKDEIIAELWRHKRDERRVRDKKVEEFEALEEIRDRVNADRETKRNQEEIAYIHQVREQRALVEQQATERRAKAHYEKLLQWKIDASNRACAKREQDRRKEQRDQKTQERADQRSRRLRESAFLETARTKGTAAAGQTSPNLANDANRGTMSATLGVAGQGAALAETQPDSEVQDFHKTYEQQERQKRHAEREERRKQEEAKKSKLQQLGATNPNAAEIARIKELRRQEDVKKQALEEAQLARELAQEEKVRAENVRKFDHQQKWEALEVLRRERELEREKVRNSKCIERIQNLGVGKGLPVALVF